MKRYLIFLFFFGMTVVVGCRNDQEKETQQAVPPQPQKKVSVEFRGCRTCHPAVRHDKHHDFPCIDCHKGDENGRDEQTAHEGLVAKPAHPDFMAESCGSCHPDNVRNCRKSLHFTLSNKINRIREHFGSSDTIETLTDISSSPNPTTTTELVDDMLRRRCLRCHLYYAGDTYANTQRGTGCAACHMSFSNGQLSSHEMIGLPGDFQCLGCHYANFVGADYYGRYEHDFGSEYRTPFITHEEYIRPYGVEYHELAPDIHQQKGLSCVDCHNGHQNFMIDGTTTITCRSCHQIDIANPDKQNLPINLAIKNDTPLLTARLTGEIHVVPQMSHPAHNEYGDKVDCQVCHAQWSFNDTTTHLLRNDSDDYYPWAQQYVQSSSAVEKLLEHNIYSDGEELPAEMPDTVTGKNVPGVWYKGFTERRWERMLFRKDTDGVIRVFRPILDLRLSYVDNDENVVFDNIQGPGKVLLPYTPHTTGKAGMFYLNRFSNLLNEEMQTSSRDQ